MLDIKSKSSKKTKITSVILIGLAAALFVALFPQFEKRAEEYCKSFQMSDFEDENFVKMFLRSNYVLYKDVMDKSGEKNYTYQELYMEKQETAITEAEQGLAAGIENVAKEQKESIVEFYTEQIQAEAANIRNGYANSLGKRMDYCVREKSTGTILKNTSRQIENMTEGGTEWENPYVYYVVLDYDKAGNLENVSVKSKNADQLLKVVQVAAKDGDSRMLNGREETEQYALYDEGTELVESLFSITQKKPSDVTFVYAMTQEQMTAFSDMAVYGEDFITTYAAGPDKTYAYYVVGVANVYWLLLGVLFAAALLLAKYKPERAADTEGQKLPAEFIFFIGMILFGVFSEGAMALVNSAGQDGFANWMNRNLPVSVKADTLEYILLENGISFVCMAALFGIWYWCALSIKDIVNGPFTFVKNRSLIYKYWNQIVGFFKKTYENFKTEILSVDLGKDTGRTLRKLVFLNFFILAVISCFWTVGIIFLVGYSFAVYVLFKKYIHKIQEQYGKLLGATNAIATGNLNNAFTEDFGIFESYKEELYKIQDGFKMAVDEEVKSQKMKTELITNVSHDLKTPLTAIITYIDLLKEENITEEQRREYLDTLERKSLRLKVLIEDLFEVSKANSKSVKLEPVSVDICNLLRQVYLEHEDKMKAQNLEVRFDIPEEKIILWLDSQKTYRVFENLYVNASKYALPGTRVFITVKKKEPDGRIWIEIKNISAKEITVNADDLTERFVRGDAARNTEGSGLGLAIAKSFVELQNGKLKIETDGDLFKVIIEW